MFADQRMPLRERPLEREILLSGIGGQGIQLAAKSLAVAAMREGRRVLMFGTYGAVVSEVLL
jgi:Pyruvate/2-oxoacid:ferredoxin oxidoreductase gamma subunit